MCGPSNVSDNNAVIKLLKQPHTHTAVACLISDDVINSAVITIMM